MNSLKFSLMVCFVAALIVIPAGAQNRKTQGPATVQAAVDYHQYRSYFEKNNSGLKGRASYLVLVNQREFDKTFGAAATATDNDFLPEGIFKTRLVIAAIRRGNSISEYTVKQITSSRGKLFVWYDAVDRAQESATYSSPLILAVDKGKYKEVVFMENGKRAATIRLKK
jgi:hypothetical protein